MGGGERERQRARASERERERASARVSEKRLTAILRHGESVTLRSSLTPSIPHSSESSGGEDLLDVRLDAITARIRTCGQRPALLSECLRIRVASALSFTFPRFSLAPCLSAIPPCPFRIIPQRPQKQWQKQIRRPPPGHCHDSLWGGLSHESSESSPPPPFVSQAST